MNREKHPFNKLSDLQFKAIQTMEKDRAYTAQRLGANIRTMKALHRYGLVRCLNPDERGNAIIDPCKYRKWVRAK